MDELKEQRGGEPVVARSNFPTAWDLLLMLGVYFTILIAVMVVSTLGLLILGYGIQDLPATAMGYYLAVTSLLSLSLTAGFYQWYRRRRSAVSLRIPFTWRKINLPLMGWAFVVMLTSGIVLEPLFELFPPLDQQVGSGPGTFLALVVVAPLGEEYICRGVLFGSLRQRYGTTLAVVLSALFFGILHVHPVAVINATMMGLVLAFVYAISRTLWAHILLHAANNLTDYLFLLYGYDQVGFSDLLAGHPWLYAVAYAVALGVTVCSIGWLWCKARRTASGEKKTVVE